LFYFEYITDNKIFNVHTLSQSVIVSVNGYLDLPRLNQKVLESFFLGVAHTRIHEDDQKNRQEDGPSFNPPFVVALLDDADNSRYRGSEEEYLEDTIVETDENEVH